MDLLDTNTKALAQIATKASAQQEHLKDILEETKADSQWMKVLAFVALMYLPANLLAVSISRRMLLIWPETDLE